MSKIQASGDVDGVKPEDLPVIADKFFQEVLRVVNGGLDFDTNFNAKEVAVTFVSANTDTAVVHNLGLVADRYIITSSTVQMVVYKGSATSSSSILYLKSSAVGSATILVY